MVEIVIGTAEVILEIADTVLEVNEGDPAPAPVAPYTNVDLVYTVGGKDYYSQSLIKTGAFTPT